MMTVVTTMDLRSGAADEWERLIQERFQSAQDREGWISGQLLSPTESSDVRVIIGTWRTKADWEAWHEDPAFLQNRTELDALQSSGHVTVWYDVIDDARA